MTFALLRIIEPFTSLHAAKDTGKKIILEAFLNEARMHFVSPDSHRIKQ